jgi:hypothetical protein
VLALKCFDRCRADRPNFEVVLEVVQGDVSERNFGATAAMVVKLLAETDWVINCAANVEFMEPLKKIVMDNVVSALHVLDFAKRCHRLRGMVHVSTAYVNANKPGQVQESIYTQWCRLASRKLSRVRCSRCTQRRWLMPGVDRYHDSPQELYEWILRTDSNHIQQVLPNILCGMPNTYTFSKQLAEVRCPALSPVSTPPPTQARRSLRQPGFPEAAAAVDPAEQTPWRPAAGNRAAVLRRCLLPRALCRLDRQGWRRRHTLPRQRARPPIHPPGLAAARVAGVRGT